MGATDIERQAPNVFKMKLLGAEIKPVTSGTATLKDAMNEALRDWVSNVTDTFYVIGTVAGPHPYPMMVRDFQSVIGKETKQQILIYSLILFFVSLLPYYYGFAKEQFLVFGILINLIFLLFSYRILVCDNNNTEKKASELFKFSILYLYFYFIILVVEKLSKG